MFHWILGCRTQDRETNQQIRREANSGSKKATNTGGTKSEEKIERLSCREKISDCEPCGKRVNLVPTAATTLTQKT